MKCSIKRTSREVTTRNQKQKQDDLKKSANYLKKLRVNSIQKTCLLERKKERKKARRKA